MVVSCFYMYSFFFCKQKTAYEMRISDWSSDVCSSDLKAPDDSGLARRNHQFGPRHQKHRCSDDRQPRTKSKACTHCQTAIEAGSPFVKPPCRGFELARIAVNASRSALLGSETSV